MSTDKKWVIMEEDEVEVPMTIFQFNNIPPSLKDARIQNIEMFYKDTYFTLDSSFFDHFRYPKMGENAKEYVEDVFGLDNEDDLNAEQQLARDFYRRWWIDRELKEQEYGEHMLENGFTYTSPYCTFKTPFRTKVMKRLPLLSTAELKQRQEEEEEEAGEIKTDQMDI